MRPSRVRLLAAGMAAALLGVGLLVYGLTVPLEINQTRTDASTVLLADGGATGQTFVAHYPGLTRIAVKMADGSSLAGLRLRVMSGDRQLLTASGFHREAEAGWIGVDFPPLSYESPQDLTFTLTNDSSQAILLYAHASNMYPEGERLGGPGDLLFRAAFRPPAGQAVPILFQRLAEHKPGIAGSPWTYLIVLAALTAAFVALGLALAGSLRPIPGSPEAGARPETTTSED